MKINKKYTASTIQQCLEKASKELNVNIDKLNYEVLEEKNSFFKKRAEILVKNIKDEEVKKPLHRNEDSKNGSARVENSKIIVTDPLEGGRPAILKSGEGIKLYVNGDEVNNSCEVFEKDNIECIIYEEEAKRILNIRVSPDEMTAFIDVQFTSYKKGKLKDSAQNNELTLRREVEEEKFPPCFKEGEVVRALKNKGIIFGLNEENIKATENKREISNLIVAEGVFPIDATDDTIENKFITKRKYKKDENGKVDYKSIGTIEAVNKGDIIAVKTCGKDGKDGMNIYGKKISHKAGKRIKFTAKKGCKIVDDKEVISEVKGKPVCFDNVYFVDKIYEVLDDVDLKIGNIKFDGQVWIKGGILEGMSVNAGAGVIVNKNVSGAKIIANDEIEIKGNVLYSQILGGRAKVIDHELKKFLREIGKLLQELIKVADQVDKLNLLGRKVNYGELIKILMENKFRRISRLSNEFIDFINKMEIQSEIGDIIKIKLIGHGPLSISNPEEIKELCDKIEVFLEENDMLENKTVDILLPYVQDSKISCSGSVYINGKGEYVSYINAGEKVVFGGLNSVARGGAIKAGDEIRCNIVGSTAGVVTILEVDKHGHIWAEKVYHNTKIKIGSYESIIEEPCRKVHGYIDKNGELTIDKFNDSI